MTSIVQVEPGQWVLAYKPEFGPHPVHRTLHQALENLQYGGSGYDCLRESWQQFDIVQADRVMPKTVLTSDGVRIHRDLIVAAAGSAGEVEALRETLFGIGHAADRAIEEETQRLIAAFERKTRADALARVHASLPHIFGRQP